MEQQLTPGAAITRAFASSRQQLQNALDHLNNQEQFLLENAEQFESTSVDDYNAAVDLNEKLTADIEQSQREVSALKLEVHGLKEKQVEFEHAALDAKAKASKAEVKITAETSRADIAERELKRLRELNPDRLARNNKEKTKLLDEQRKALTELRTSNITLKRTNTEDQAKIAELVKVIAEADAEVQELRRQDKYRALYNLHLKKHFFADEDKEKSVPYFAYVIPHGLQSLDDQLLDLEWKIFVMSATGEGAAILMSEWICPVLPPCSFARSVPKELVDAIMYFALDALAETHQPLIERATWSQSVSVRDVVPAKQAEILEANSVITLHDIMMYQAFKLSKIKGISDKSAQSIMECANKYVADNYRVEEREAA